MQEDIVHQCPFCELKFLYMSEVKDHIMSDHKEHADEVAGAEPHEIPR